MNEVKPINPEEQIQFSLDFYFTPFLTYVWAF